VEWEDEELLPTAEDKDSSDRSVYQGQGGCGPQPQPPPLPERAWQWPPLKTAFALWPEEAGQREEDDSDSLDNGF
jgi:hypothetical protein